MISLLYIVLGLIGLILVQWVVGRLPKLPGPWGIPILGYFPWLGMKMNQTLTDLSKMYGPVYQLQMGSRRMVIVNGQKAIREALTGSKGADFAGRPDFYSYRLFGVFGAYGYPAPQKMYKKMTLRAMGMFANNKKEDLTKAATDAFDMLVEEFKSRDGQAFDPKLLMYDVVWTIMGFICYGRHFNRNDPEVRQIIETADEFSKTVMFGVICDYLPWAKRLMNKQLTANATVINAIESQSVKLAAQNAKDWDGESLRNIADMFRVADKERTEEEKAQLALTDDALLKMLTNLFGAGFATVAVTVKWALLFMARHPEMQAKVQEELDTVLDGRKYPSFEDEKNLPYTSAVLAETYRVSSMAALAMTHLTLKDTSLQGFPIPANTPVVINLFSAHYDSAVYEDPETFDPNRFLVGNELNKAKVETVMPYSLGLRRCGGEILARMEIFLFFACILYHCNIKAGPGEVLDPKNYRFGLGLDPIPFKLSFTPRHAAW